MTLDEPKLRSTLGGIAAHVSLDPQVHCRRFPLTIDRMAHDPFVPKVRIRSLTNVPVRPEGDYVLYWMTAFRRLRSNFALQRAVELSIELQKPLLILEAVRVGYPWACDRFHRYLLDGMRDNQADASATRARYLAYVEPRHGDGHDLVQTCASSACAVVTDDFPCFFHPTLYSKIVRRWKSYVEAVDSNGILPIHQADRTFTVAHSYRRYMQKVIASDFPIFPKETPLEDNALPAWRTPIPQSLSRWKFLSSKELASFELSGLTIDHAVAPTGEQGGPHAASESLRQFVQRRIHEYAEARNEPDQRGSSGLSSYLHFGHLSPHDVFQAMVGTVKGWTPEKLSKPNGKMTGFWNLGEHVEAFVDQLLTWREIGFNMCAREPQYARYESLPDWAQKTLQDHASDPRPWIYTQEQFETASTHDPLWNAAQRQLVGEGRIHNYLRMLWGKKILHWSASPRQALDIMIELNNKYALDGRDPNSYSGIFWILGRYDRAWGPERPIFGKVRYMTSESTRAKYSVKAYLHRYAEDA